MRSSVAALGLIVLAPDPCVTSSDVAVASGLYEAWSPLTMRPVGPLAAAPDGWPRWLKVESVGERSKVTFEPDERVVWDTAFGPCGVVAKDTLMDGARWTRSTFRYDDACHLVLK